MDKPTAIAEIVVTDRHSFLWVTTSNEQAHEWARGASHFFGHVGPDNDEGTVAKSFSLFVAAVFDRQQVIEYLETGYPWYEAPESTFELVESDLPAAAPDGEGAS